MYTLGELSLASLASLLIGAILTHLLAKQRSHQDRRAARFNAASEELRKAFVSEIATLRSNVPAEPGSGYDLLKEAFPKHERAIYSLRNMLNGNQRDQYDEAWRQYFYPEGVNIILPELEVKTYMLAQYIGINHKDEVEKRQIAIQRLEALMSFAVVQ
ncbi:hypothetical protein [Hydrogenophaga sp.]|uniref:hypothetical protein n=1 Tax=Hydrogenophaga sp. TaxID=1904254 RepID=UPI002727FFD1|nr:hypothetical protein [Hydrogenophaga sp.]MDO8905870.1 hypothetical protein [Hydrogenophaga sp.]